MGGNVHVPDAAGFFSTDVLRCDWDGGVVNEKQRKFLAGFSASMDEDAEVFFQNANKAETALQVTMWRVGLALLRAQQKATLRGFLEATKDD